ncbi:MAG: type II secretion system protein GspM, partial [Burkholderiaceae bacterium]
MSGRSLTLPPALVSLRAEADKWWLARTARERRAVIVVLAVLAVLVVWSLFVQPAWRSARAAPAVLDQLDGELQQMQRVAGESRVLRAVAPVSQTQAGAALKAASERLGDKAKLNLQGDRATLTLTGISPEALRAWLNEARSG